MDGPFPWDSDSEGSDWETSDYEVAVVVEVQEIELAVKEHAVFEAPRTIKIVLPATIHSSTPVIFRNLFDGEITSREAERRLRACMDDDDPTLCDLTRQVPALFGPGTESYVYTAPTTPLLLRPDFDRSVLDVPWQIVGHKFSTEVRLFSFSPQMQSIHSYSFPPHSAPFASDHSGMTFEP